MAPDAGACPPPPTSYVESARKCLCFNLSGTHELHSISSIVASGHDAKKGSKTKAHALRVVVVVVFTLKTVPISAQYVLTPVVVQLTQKQKDAEKSTQTVRRRRQHVCLTKEIGM